MSILFDPRWYLSRNADVAASGIDPLRHYLTYGAAEGLTFENIIKSMIFLTDLGDFQTVNELYGSYFKSDPPA